MKRMAAIFLGLRALVATALVGSPAGHAQESPSADDAAWAAASDFSTAESCQQYLEAFPAGRHAEEAFRCLIESSLEAVPAGALDFDIY